MKRILALLAVMCMLVCSLAACGGGAEDYYDTKLGYIEDLAAAIKDKDSGEISDVEADIRDWAKDYAEEALDVREDINDQAMDDTEDVLDMQSRINNASLSEAALKAKSEMDSQYGKLSKYTEADLDLLYELYDLELEANEDLADAAEDNDSEEFKEIANEYKAEFKELYDEYKALEDDYKNKIKELEKEYGKDIVSQAEAKFDTAFYSGAATGSMSNFNF